MQLAILSQPPGSVEGRLRITEQGEMVQAKFGVPSVALRQLEVFSNSVLTATLQVGGVRGRDGCVEVVICVCVHGWVWLGAISTDRVVGRLGALA